MNGRMRTLAAGGAVAILAGGAGIGYALHGDSKTSPSTAPAATTVTGSAATFTLAGQFSLALGAFQWDHAADGTTPCVSDQGYSDITAGAPVVITDQSGTTIATGQLITGSATVDSATGRATACVFSFVVQQVPDRPFYGVTVSHRGTQTYSAADAHAGNIRLTLG
jgi:hypothetical protein